MLNRIRDQLKSTDKRNILVNFCSLSVLQGANYILPLITVPYLVRILGPGKFGVIAIAQALIQYFIMLTDYGFNFYATREISINRDNTKKVTEIFSAVMTARICFMLIAFSILSLMVLFIPRFKEDYALYLIAFGMVVGNVLFPIWFFQGMERMKYITILNILARLIFTVSIFLVVHKQSDYLFVPLLNSLGFITSGIISLVIVFHNFNIRYRLPNLNLIIEQIKNSFYFFLSRLSLSMYTVTNTFVLGMCTNNVITGYYAAADKLMVALVALSQPIANALYPYMSRTRNIHLFKKIFYLWTCAGCGLFIIFFFMNKFITNMIFGPQFHTTANILKLFSLELPIVFPSIMLGLPFLAALGFSKHFNMSLVISSLIHIIGLLIIIPFINVYLIVIMTIITQALILSIRLYGVKKYNLWSISNDNLHI